MQWLIWKRFTLVEVVLAVGIKLFIVLRHSINEVLISFSSLPLDKEYKTFSYPGRVRSCSFKYFWNFSCGEKFGDFFFQAPHKQRLPGLGFCKRFLYGAVTLVTPLRHAPGIFVRTL